MKSAVLILLALAVASCQSQTSQFRDAPQEPVPMGSGRVETKMPGER